jgi:hypothetical protein
MTDEASKQEANHEIIEDLAAPPEATADVVGGAQPVDGIGPVDGAGPVDGHRIAAKPGAPGTLPPT